jgi:hypothetical protein
VTHAESPDPDMDEPHATDCAFCIWIAMLDAVNKIVALLEKEAKP